MATGRAQQIDPLHATRGDQRIRVNLGSVSAGEQAAETGESKLRSLREDHFPCNRNDIWTILGISTYVMIVFA